ncbi:MAG: hypothetical protein ACRDPV_15915 [Gaiellaceae bacterium]
MLTVASLAAAVEPARACSCIPPDPRSYLEKADGAFVGRLVSRREADQGRAVLTFSVERAVKGKIGDTVEVTTANNGAACGIETSVGRRIGLFLMRERDGWVGHLCWQVDPADLLAAAALPAPNGKGPVALFVGGRFGPARTIALDAKGRTLAYGLGAGGLLSPCPGRQRLAQIGGDELVLRDARTLQVIRRQPFQLPGKRLPIASLCEDSAGSSVVIFAEWARGDAPFRAAIYRLEGSRLKVVWQGTAYLSSLNPGIAYLRSGAAANRLVSVDLKTGRVVPLAWLRLNASLVPDATGKLLAGVAYQLVERSRVVLLDLTTRPAKLRSSPLAAPEVSGDLFWLPSGRLLFIPWYGRDTARVLDLTLRTRSKFRWIAEGSTLVGTTVFGIDRRGRLTSAKLPSGPQRLLRRLPGEPHLIVSAMG